MKIDLTELSSMWLQKVILIINAEILEIHISDLDFTEIIFILVSCQCFILGKKDNLETFP